MTTTAPARRWWMSLAALPLFLLGGCVQSMFYYPDRVRYETPDALGLRYENVRFTSADGTRLSGWFIPAAGRADPKATKRQWLLMFCALPWKCTTVPLAAFGSAWPAAGMNQPLRRVPSALVKRTFS